MPTDPAPGSAASTPVYYDAHDPARGALARGMALVWGIPDWWLVVRAWGRRCQWVEYADGTQKCAKCKASSARLEDEDGT